MIYTLDEKQIGDGKLVLEKYYLEPESAEALGRPLNSAEIQLRYEFSLGGSQTSPDASWYLSIDHFKGLFNSIGTEEDFNEVVALLRGDDSELVAKVEDYLKENKK